MKNLSVAQKIPLDFWTSARLTTILNSFTVFFHYSLFGISQNNSVESAYECENLGHSHDVRPSACAPVRISLSHTSAVGQCGQIVFSHSDSTNKSSLKRQTADVTAALEEWRQRSKPPKSGQILRPQILCAKK